MKSFATLLLNVALAVGFVFAGMHAASAWMKEPPAQRKLDMTAQTLWTLEPIRIDRSSQTYERLPTPPDPFPVKFRADRGVRVVDSATFEREGKRYRVAGAPVVLRNKVCVGEDGSRNACGLKAFKALDNALRGNFVECRIEEEQVDMTEQRPLETARCRVNGRDLAMLLSA